MADVYYIVCNGADGYSTCTECEEENFNLLAFWKQLNQVKLERNHMNAFLRGFSCTHRDNSSTIYLNTHSIHPSIDQLGSYILNGPSSLQLIITYSSTRCVGGMLPNF